MDLLSKESFIHNISEEFIYRSSSVDYESFEMDDKTSLGFAKFGEIIHQVNDCNSTSDYNLE